jgi:carotenoid cleavage dioxygenase-like enzyme
MAPHDFATTASSYVLTVPPMKLNLLPYLAGLTGPANCVSLAQAPMRMYVVPRNDPDKEHLVRSASLPNQECIKLTSPKY